MNFLSRVYYFFSSYADHNERSVGLFFNGLSEHSNQDKTRKRLSELVQRNIAVINLWSEYRYKGYDYLRKSNRKKLYENLRFIAEDFETFRVNHAPSHDDEHIVLIQAMMDYFSPRRGTYQYHESSSFGRLLRNPAHEKLIGDCNQIVTLYIYIYSLYFDVKDLQIRLLPEHVALHYDGIDIETTNGTFANYSHTKGAKLMPIEEIVSVNLLDTTDSYLETHEVKAEDFLQSSRFAFILSHERAIVTNNLDAAYGKLIHLLMERNNYKQALKFARASHDVELIGLVSHNGAVHSIQQNNFAAARKFAKDAPKHDQLIRDSYHNEGIYHYDAHRYHDAIKAFKKYGDTSMIRNCYEALFFTEQQKLGSNLTTESIKKYTGTIKRMRTYAKKSHNKNLVEHTDRLNKYL